MHNRINFLKTNPEIVQAARALNQAIEGAGLDKKLLELIKIRASQINGCAHCLHMHTSDALKLGITPTKIFVLSGWRESTLYSAAERAVLAWTEALTNVSREGAPQPLYEDLKAHFHEPQILQITSAIGMINYWNRIAIGFGIVNPAEKNAE